jgi:hypothetical protein
LAKLIQDKGIHAKPLVGSIHKSDRCRILNAFKRGDLRVVVATTLADEGLDVQRLSRVILALPGRGRGRTIQRLGLESFKQLGIKVHFTSHLGEFWLVPVHRDNTRQELTPEHLAVICHALKVFPGAAVTAFEPLSKEKTKQGEKR